MHRLLRYFIFQLIFVVVTTLPSLAAKRVALVIGNSAYEHATPLKNPKNDAEAMALALTRVGFDVVQGIDLSHVDFAQSVGEFRKKLRGADVGLLFYAGHGLQVHGQNYLMPTDARLDDETALDFEAVPLRTILRLMERETTTNLVFLDACRDNPLARNLARSMGTRSTALGQGLARVESGLGTLVSFATQPGNVALDGDAGANSPFATGMLKHLDTPGLDVELVMRRVREDVIKSTSGSQVPWSNSSLTGSFIFQDKPKQKPPAPPVASVPSIKPGAVMRGVDPLAVELAFWQAAKDAGTPDAYKTYLGKYPGGNFARFAEIHLKELEQVKAADKKQQADLEVAKKKQAEAEKARRTADAAKRKQELAALEQKQAEERTRFEKERTELAERLKAMEAAATQRAAEKQEKEQKVASLQPAGAPAVPVLDEHTMALVLQNELRRVGCDPGKVDGVWGQQGSGALAQFNQHASLKLQTGTPTMEAIETVKGTRDRVCPLVCGAQYNAVNDQCVKKTCRSGQQLTTRGQCVNVVVRKPRTVAPVAKKKTAKKRSKYEECYSRWGYEPCEKYR